MKVFSLKKFKESESDWKNHLDWAKQCDGQPVKNGHCKGKNGCLYGAIDKWCEEITPKKKFKAGDKVKVVGNGDTTHYYEIGSIVEIVNDEGKTFWCVDKNGKHQHVDKSDVAPIGNDKLIFKGNATILIKDGKKYVSKCQDGDAFDFEKGLLLCLAKANGVNYEDLKKMLDGAIFADKKARAEGRQVKEVKRHAKVGEYIKIIEATITGGEYKNGDIRKVARESAKNKQVHIESERHKYGFCVYDTEYVVLENYKPYKITLSEFWKSEEKLAIEYKNEGEGKRIFETMMKKRFCCDNSGDVFWGQGTLWNEKNCLVTAINESSVECAKNRGYKIYKADEVDLNN